MADDSPLTPRRGFEKYRLEALIDGIFAVALTLLVLDIKLPEGSSFSSNRELWERLLELERHFVIYVISFVVIAIYWVAHHVQFHYVRYTDRRLIWINMAFLLVISFLPFATDMVGDHETLILPCEIYGLALLVLSALTYVHLRYLANHPHLASPELTDEAVRLLAHRIGLFAIVPALSMVIAFYSPRVALYVYMLLAASHFFPGQIDQKIVCTPGSELVSEE